MNKTDLVAKISQETGLAKVDSQVALTAILEEIGDALKKGNSVTLVGFGTFSAGERAARKGRNPKTGQEIQIPAKKVVRFKPGKNLRESV